MPSVERPIGPSSRARVTDATATSIAAACDVRVALKGEGWLCAKYDARADEFVVALKASRPQSPGPSTIVVEVRAGSVVVNTVEAVVSLR